MVKLYAGVRQDMFLIYYEAMSCECHYNPILYTFSCLCQPST